jgi:hypothetical protein
MNGDPAAPALRDIRGPVVISDWTTFLIVLAALAVVALVIWLGLRRRRSVAPPAVPRKSAGELARERLVLARALMEPERAREFSHAVSEAVREYVEGRFGARAPRRTTDEFLRDAARDPGSELARHAPLLDAFLHRCDLVKFARAPLTRGEMEGLHSSAWRFVEESTPPTLGEAVHS